MDLIEEIATLRKKLDYSVKQLRKNGIDLAQKEMDYKIALTEECLKLRDEMPVTLIDKICYGLPRIAKLRFDRDCAEALYGANQEAINSIKLQLRLVEAQLAREWTTDDSGI